jgi:dehydrogenase/reductase SDR family protein 12
MTLWNTILDASVIESFDLHGFERHAQSFQTADTNVDLTGKIALVTGANSGIGFALSMQLAQRGATVYLLCRNPDRAQEAVEQIVSVTKSETVFWHPMDLSDLEHVRDNAQTLLQRLDGQSIDVFVQNAGVLPLEEWRSPQGFEMTLATNLLGHHLLTRLLESQLNGRMVLVSSGGMYLAPLSVKELFASSSPKFDGVRRYALTKRAQVALTEIYAQKYNHNKLVVHSMHPGWVATPGVEHSLPGFWKRMEHRLRTPEQGADTILWLCTASLPLRNSGQFWFDRESRKTHIWPWQRHSEREMRALLQRLDTVVEPYLS